MRLSVFMTSSINPLNKRNYLSQKSIEFNRNINNEEDF